MATLQINVDDSKLTAAAWQGFLRMHPLPEENPPDVSNAAGKLAYIKSKAAQWLRFQVRRGMQLNERDQGVGTPDDFDVTAPPQPPPP